MSMKLTVDDLMAIANSLQKLEDTGVEVSQFRCKNHTIVVERVGTGQMEDPHYIVKGITNGATRGDSR